METRHAEKLGVALWAGQVALYLAYGLTGISKALVPAADLQGRLHLFEEVPAAVLPLAGAVEVALALLVVLPAATRVLPAVSGFSAGVLAALGLLGALVPSMGAFVGLPLPGLAAAAVAAFVAWGRLGPARIQGFWERDEAREIEERFRQMAPRARAPGSARSVA